MILRLYSFDLVTDGLFPPATPQSAELSSFPVVLRSFRIVTAPPGRSQDSTELISPEDTSLGEAPSLPATPRKVVLFLRRFPLAYSHRMCFLVLPTCHCETSSEGDHGPCFPPALLKY